jgi:hypothetical protein
MPEIKYPTRSIAKSVDTESLIDQAIRVSADPIVRRRGRGWFPRLVREVLRFFISNHKAGKS